MSFDIAATSSTSYKPTHREAVDISMDISTKLDSKNYDGKIELKGGEIEVTTGSGTSTTAAVTGAPPIVIALGLLKILSDNQNATQKASYTATGLYEHD